MVDGRPIYLGNPMGIVIEPKRGPRLYHMGDTDIFSDMALINELYHPKIGLVPVGDRFTMGGKTAAQAVHRYFAFECRRALPLRHVRSPGADAERIRRRARRKAEGASCRQIGEDGL